MVDELLNVEHPKEHAAKSCFKLLQIPYGPRIARWRKPADRRAHYPWLVNLASLDPKDRVVRWIRQGLELALDLAPQTLQIGLYYSRLLFIWNLDHREGLSAPAVLKLAPTRRAQVANPIRLTARGHKVALAVQLEDVDRHSAPAPRLAALYPKGRYSTEPPQEGVCH